MKAIERYERGLITRDEYLELVNLPDVTLDNEIAHLLKLANNHQFGWIYHYANKIRPLVENEHALDAVIDFAFDCRNLKVDMNDLFCPTFIINDFKDSFETLICWINTIVAPVPKASLEVENGI